MWEFWGPIWKAARLAFFPDHYGVEEREPNFLSNHVVQSKDLKSGRLLGKGVSSIVYETRWNGKRYARKDFLQVQRDVFKREAIVLVHLKSHPNVVQTYFWTIDKRSCSLVLEFMDDDLLNVIEKRKTSRRQIQNGLSSSELPQKSHLMDLHKFIEELRNVGTWESPLVYPFNIREAVPIIRQIAEGMRFLHENEVAHGDLKPRNILVMSFGRTNSNSLDRNIEIRVKVADFGLVRTKKKSMSLVSCKAKKLEMARWRAPELFDDLNILKEDKDESSADSDSDSDANHKASDANAEILWNTMAMKQADVYSFALTCSQILTGEEPYRGLGLKELVEKIPTNLRPGLPPHCPEKLDSLIKRCWGEKASRPSFTGVLSDLEEILQATRTEEEFIPSAGISSDVDSKGISSVVSRTDDQEAFKEIHEELDTLEAQADFDAGFSEPGQVRDFESSSEYERTDVLTVDAERDLKETVEIVAQTKDFEQTTGTDMEEVTQVVLEKSGLLDASDELSSYLQIDPADITIEVPVRPLETNSKQYKQNKVGWAVVHFGKWLGCDFAIKVFKSGAIDGTVWNKKRLLREIGAFIKLQHPHIVRLVGFGLDAERCFFLMELMDADLRNFMKKKLEPFPRPKPRPFKRPEELDIITQIAKGMYYMHTQQYVHGDLKCSNILVKKYDDYLKVKIADLLGSQNLHKVWDAESLKQASLTRRPRWTAPEAIEHYGWVEPPKELLMKGDVYSFGMTCYEVVTGKYPFDGIREGELPKLIQAGFRPDLPGDLDEDLDWLIKLCWEHDPNKRPEFREICHLLDYITSEKPVVVSNRSFSKDKVLSSMKRIPQVRGLSTGLVGMVHQEKEQAINSSKHASSGWGVIGEGGLPYSGSALLVPEYLHVQPDQLIKVRGIAAGYCSQVYKAVWLGCTVAVKVLEAIEFIQDLQQQVHILIKLSRHPFIVQILGITQCSIVMEFMDGSLRELIDSRMQKRSPVTMQKWKFFHKRVVPFDLCEAVPIITKIALVMAFLHSKGVVHRDLKSRRFLVKEHATSIEVKLSNYLDLELADCGEIHYGPYLDFGFGTRFWRAPEVLPKADRSKKPDLKAADVYSFAMTCYEVLTGEIPLSDLRPNDYASVIDGCRPTLPSHLHKGLIELIEQCWHADPVRRPNFIEICEELQKIQQSLPE